eukprot:CAMPEP_0118893732 /NCGR_PEP_ID=MMETSP1166-20130328/2822_1 /TAXON_ID=1104430 /ORGANISM="Chrysoreinhardia sp, Strain CCMP3193" /LENGTH=63 /DNA_ID=CAMNT_0006832579 /DNA_START=82 /DNA_END=273 /DNA_ORIENTATION=-
MAKIWRSDRAGSLASLVARCDAVEVAAGNRDEAGTRRGVVALAVGSVAPSNHRSVVAKRDTVV